MKTFIINNPQLARLLISKDYWPIEFGAKNDKLYFVFKDEGEVAVIIHKYRSKASQESLSVLLHLINEMETDVD